MVVEAPLSEQPSDRPVAQSDLEHALARVPGKVSLEIRVDLHVCAIEARQALGRGVLHTHCAREMGAAELVPEFRVCRVQLLLGVLAAHGPIMPHLLTWSMAPSPSVASPCDRQLALLLSGPADAA